MHSLANSPVLDLVMRAPIQLQCIFSYTILANPELEPHSPNTYQLKLGPGGSINSNRCEGSTSRLHLCQHLRESAKRIHLGGMPPSMPPWFIGRYGGIFGGEPPRYVHFDLPLKS